MKLLNVDRKGDINIGLVTHGHAILRRIVVVTLDDPERPGSGTPGGNRRGEVEPDGQAVACVLTRSPVTDYTHSPLLPIPLYLPFP